MRTGQLSKEQGITALLESRIKLSRGEGQGHHTLVRQDTPQNVKTCRIRVTRGVQKSSLWLKNPFVRPGHLGRAGKIDNLSNSITLALILSYNVLCTVSWESRCILSLFKADPVSGVLKTAGNFREKGSQPAFVVSVNFRRLRDQTIGTDEFGTPAMGVVPKVLEHILVMGPNNTTPHVFYRREGREKGRHGRGNAAVSIFCLPPRASSRVSSSPGRALRWGSTEG